MASGESQKQLLSLIRSYASEKSQEEVRASDLKKRLLDLQNDLNVANAELDEAKLSREVAEQELRGLQVQRAMIGASVQALQARIGLLHKEILKLRSDLDALKGEEWIERDGFITIMSELNKEIRQFQEITVNAFQKEKFGQLPSDSGPKKSKPEETQTLDKQDVPKLKEIEEKNTCLRTRIQELEAEYQLEQLRHGKVQEELACIEKRWFLVTTIMEETKKLQELAGQTAELEKVYASLGEDLQRKCTCPSCGSNNIEAEGTENIQSC